MRKLLVSLLWAGLILASSSEAMAQKSSGSRELNERVKALRERLQAFQTKNELKPSALINEAEVAVKVETIVEELENRSDVAVTVLFHDPEAVVKETPVHTASISAIDVLASKKSLESEVSTDKKEVSNANSKRYEELRRRVYAATKSVYSRLDGSPQIARIK